MQTAISSASRTPSDHEKRMDGIAQLVDKVSIHKIESEHVDIIDNAASLSDLVDLLFAQPTRPPSIYIDVEGEDLSRDGTVSILQLYLLPTKRTYLIDIFTLGESSFTVSGKDGGTLRGVLESATIPKVFFDVRNDSDALYSSFGVLLAGIQDLQLMELASRSFNRRFVNGLSKCIERDGRLTVTERRQWMQCKEKGRRLFAPELGGSYAVFNKRPLEKDIFDYCAQDVQLLPRLWEYYNGKVTPRWRERVLEASGARVAESQSDSYVAHGRHKALAPKTWNRLD
jgi:exonuclease 3'-5' domain-containing protein 1